MKFKRLIYGSLLSLSLFTTCSLFNVVAATNGVVGVYAGNECLAAEFDKVSGASSYTAYIKGGDISSYQEIDSQLVRVSDDNVRVDAVGLKAGTYSLKLVSNTSVEIELTDINVTADDRSGYAHYNYNDGVGAYKDDGTLKDDAVVVYVSDSNKNTVQATFGGKTYTGLYNILANSSSSYPVDIRVIGAIKTRQWDYVDTKKVFGEGKNDARKTSLVNYYYKSEYSDAWNYTGSNTYDRLYEDDIKYYELNTMNNDSPIVELDDLTNYISYVKDSSKSNYQCFDTYFNMMDIKSKSNITIEGIGTDAEIFQWGFTFSKCNSIEVKNLTFTDYPEDAVGFEGKDNSDMDYGNYWVHNCTFNEGKNNLDLTFENDKTDGDGSSDLKYAHNLTISYCKYNGTHKTNLLGSNNTASQYNITLHHNYYNGCKARLPLVRQANIHVYNNYYSGTTSTGISVRAQAYAFIENNYFDGKNPFMLAYKTADKFNPIGTTIKAIGNEFGSSVTVSAVDKDTDQGLGLMANGIYVLTTKDTASYDSITVNTNVTRTTTSTGSSCTNNNTDYANFDTNPDLFYYDNNKSDVTVMNSASELPTVIPTVAGAGILKTTTYTITGGSSAEPEPVIDQTPVYNNTSYVKVFDEDFSDSISITKSLNVPTNSGLYYRITDDIDSNDYNNVTVDNGRVKVYDNSGSNTTGDGASRTTNAYYMFDSGNHYNSGIVKYSLDIEVPVSGKWKIISFINVNSTDLALYSNADKYLTLKYGASEVNITTDVYSSGTYHVSLEINYDTNDLSLSVGNNKATINNYNSGAIKGLLFTTSASSARTYYFDNVQIDVKDTLKLGYQLGSYTQNNNAYYALRIIGKIEYNDIYANLDDIESIKIDIVIENANGVQTKVLNKNIDNVYKSLKISSGETITDSGDNLRYYYTVIKGITSAHSGYKIKATSTLILKNNMEVKCSGFAYEVE